MDKIRFISILYLFPLQIIKVVFKYKNIKETIYFEKEGKLSNTNILPPDIENISEININYIRDEIEKKYINL